MGLYALAAALASGIVGAAGWVAHQIRSLNVSPQSWSCVECQVSNELDRDTCWSCGAGYGQDPLYPSPIPFERRWICMSCAVWNGMTRASCWRCAQPRTDPGTGWAAASSHVPSTDTAETSYRRKNS